MHPHGKVGQGGTGADPGTAREVVCHLLPVLKFQIGIGREGDLREPRQHTTWVNDAIFLPDAQMLVVAASDR